MFLRKADSDDLVRVTNLKELTDPFLTEVTVREQAGEEEGDPMAMAKSALRFPSGEPLPRCWVDPHYRR
ncbi:MAG: acetyltransferase [Zetaproteobacteria bacterium]|nr:MAG: acetyltransferase [Zetaproteobacteria bacterium]